jgi:hypothetical protein
MKALTIQQPWAECVAQGEKLIENRSRRVFHRGPLAIHAGLRLSVRGINDPRVLAALGDFAPHTVGKVIAVCELVDCHPAAGCCKPWGDDAYGGKPVHHLTRAAGTERRPRRERSARTVRRYDAPRGHLRARLHFRGAARLRHP